MSGGDLLGRPQMPIRLSDEQRIDWLRLMRSENVGPKLFQTLINTYGGAKAAIDAIPHLTKRGGGARVIRIATRSEAEKELAQAAAMGVQIIGYGESVYPLALRMSQSAPPMVGVRGEISLLRRMMVSVVGSRNASAAGLKMATMLSRDLGAMGYAIVSGLARGIDRAAHDAACRTGTVAVLAGGHDRIYPADHAALLERYLAEGGAAISEMPFGWELRAQDFPRRNRIIAGLAAGLIVVEAAERSGSLITARLALDDNREIFAVPGSPLDPRAFGPNRLIRQGACLTTCALDVHEVLSGQGQTGYDLSEPVESGGFTPVEPDDSDRARLVSLLGVAPVSMDDLIQLSGVSAGAARVVLLELELAGRVIVTSEGRYQLL